MKQCCPRLGDHLKKLREDAGLQPSGLQITDSIFVTKEELESWERGEERISPMLLYYIAHHYKKTDKMEASLLYVSLMEDAGHILRSKK